MGKQRLEALQRQWRAESLACCLLLALASGVLLTTALHTGAGWPVWAGWPIGVLSFGVALLLFPYWRVSLTDISRYLDRLLPELEESCGLLLRADAELGPLEKLQAIRTAGLLNRLSTPHPLRKKLLSAAGVLALAVALSIGIVAAAGRGRDGATATVASGVRDPAQAEVASAPAIRTVSVRITPPAYTGRPVRYQSELALRVEEGALLTWELSTTVGVDSLQFIFNDTARLSLQPVNAGRTLWKLTAPAIRSGFYQVRTGVRTGVRMGAGTGVTTGATTGARTGAWLSTLYKLEVQADEPPQVVILAPKAYTVVDYGEPTKIPLVVQLKDDYGISDASIMATVSSGKGEAVKFKEQEIRWSRSFTGDQPMYSLSKTLDLTALGLKPGDELYFYCRAKDNKGQETRTDMYIISLTDTAQLMSLEGMTMATDVKPEYFRSERQIIIEAEQLLKEKDTIALTAFQNRSNDLGIDQKLLRLRYGKFLGEEAEEGQPGGGPSDTTNFGAFGDATKILDVFTDKHDNAEDASFFEPAVKQQLKATLNEMWKAELQLRTFRPKEALPYAYKALRLLKDLQQQSRSYVAKTGVRVTPLNPAKRETGDLAGIEAPVQKAMTAGGMMAGGTAAGGMPETAVLRIVLGVLEAVRTDRAAVGDPARVLLEQAARRLGREAAARPGEYLDAYQALRRMVGEEGDGQQRAGAGDGPAAEQDIAVIERAIRKLLPDAEPVPVVVRGNADAGLSQLYFHHLNASSGKP
jgi:hypothetical protein